MVGLAMGRSFGAGRTVGRLSGHVEEVRNDDREAEWTYLGGLACVSQWLCGSIGKFWTEFLRR